MDSVARTATFTLTAADIGAAARCQATRQVLGWRGAVAFLVFVGIFASFDPRPQGLIGGAVVAGLWLVFMTRIGLPLPARWSFARQPSLHRPVHLAWDPSGVAYSSERGESRLPWADDHRWREDARVILLIQGPGLVQPLPKRALSTARRDDMRRRASKAGPPGAPAA